MRNAIRKSATAILIGVGAAAAFGCEAPPEDRIAAPSAVSGSDTGAATPRGPLPGLDPTRPVTQFSREVWSEREGLPQNFVNALAQTPDGYLWIGSERGLVRFDGARFRVFSADETPGLPISWVRRLHTDPDGTLWLGTGGEGVVRHADGRFTHSGVEQGLRHGMVSAFLRDGADRLWVATEGGGLHRAIDDEGPGGAGGADSDEPTTFTAVGDGTPLEGATILALAEAPSGDLWIGTSEGLIRFDPEAGAVDWVASDRGLPRARIPALAVDDAGDLWVGTAGLGLYRSTDGPSGPGRFERRDPGEALSGALVTRLMVDRQGALWIATNGDGLFRYYDGRLDALDSARGFPSDLVWDLLEGREGNLWVGTNIAGLVRLSDGLFDTFGAPEGLSMDVALALTEGADGSVWVGTPGEGLNRIQGDQVTTFRAADGLGSDIVLSVAEDRAGDVWVGMAAGGLSRIRDGRVRTFGPEDGLAGSQVTVVHEDRTGQLWLGVTGAGVQAWPPTSGPLFGLDDGLPPGGFTSMADDAEGRLWVGTRDGLARIDPGGSAVEAGSIRVFTVADGLPHAAVNQLHVDSAGAVWVATMAGLARIEGDEVLTFGPGSGLPETEVMAVITDGSGFLWMTSSQGVLRVNRDALIAAGRGEGEPVEVLRLGRADGLRSVEANGGIHPAIWRASDGAIWFPTMAGAVRFDPERDERAVLAPRPVIEAVHVGSRVREAGTRARRVEGPVALSPDERSFEVQFTAPSLTAPEEVRLRYRLAGFDDAWVRAEGRRSAIYSQLPPGEYEFQVEAAGRDGEWTGLDAPLPIALEHRFVERRSVQFAGVLLLLLLVFAAYRIRIRTLQERESRLLGLVRERERTESELRRSEERLRLALDAGRMGSWEWYPETDEIVWSDAMRRLTGFVPESLAEFLEELDRRVDPDAGERLHATFDRVVQDGADDFHLDFAFRESDDEPRHLELRGQWVGEGHDDQARRLVGVAWDVSALIRTQQALRQREEELRQAQKMEAVGQLAGGVAHDFNNLLAVIGANTRLALHDLEEDHPAHEELVEVVRAGDRATTLTQQLLAFGRKQVLRPRPLDLNEVVDGVTSMMSRIIRENVVIEIEREMGLPAVRVDEGGVEQILVNLILNAQDAMPRGGEIVISTTRGMDPQRDPQVVLSVRDSGEGIPESIRDRIFEPFFTTKEQGKGTGMGLASVYGIVQQSGAELEIDSEVGVGSCFRIRFRAEVPEEVSAGRD